MLRRLFSAGAALGILVGSHASAQAERETERLANAATVMKEILGMPDSIPADLLDRAECIIVFPSVMKVAVGIGGSYGRGVIVCRSGQDFTGPWTAPAMFALEGGSIGLQLGGQATDYVLLVMNDRGADSVLGSKVKLGADASAAAGPKGRTAGASTDVAMRAEILTYSRARGLFAGISLEGSTLRADGDANQRLYGRRVSAREIVRQGAVPVPSAARPLVGLLDRRSPRNLSNKPL
ncbi:MAG TPA: lipid-binding SYLF domain-containing protein [Vicinamibacterales bacterium]|nr:lipid-binding SYLF domain-containing protein [Vicinamibacterales bacterium]